MARDRPARVLGVLRVLRLRIKAAENTDQVGHGTHGQHGLGLVDPWFCIRVIRVVRGQILIIRGLLHQPWLAEDEVVHDDDVLAALVVGAERHFAGHDLDLCDLRIVEEHAEERQAGIPG